MATLRHTTSLALAEVGDEAVESLLASGQWELASNQEPKKRAPRKAAEAVTETESE